ncbi:hypothetical protein ACFFLM_22495 [Deinococcus oregonensis]|uniref:YtxH domain-containing protein n=1 Tax=Deinococcus oregonensis TaxID=1805970 RepID=A0ABV6B718_9DEIO
MIPVNERLEQLKEKAQEARRQTEYQASGQAIKAAVKGQAQVIELLAAQQVELTALRQDVARLSRTHAKGGFPWGLLLLAGGTYALYRFSPAVHQRVNSVLGQADPSVESNLNRAKNAANDGVEDLREGRHPGDALERVGGELHRASEKTADRLKGGLDELKDEAKDRLDGRPR